ncbi:MAG: methyltransferase [Candidatus Hodarchaeales archaeon]|jgi:predicted TPR repeat methyltransferase
MPILDFDKTEDVENTLRLFLVSGALGTALELGLFWLLIEKPLKLSKISEYSAFTNKAIVNKYSKETWSFMAQEIREHNQTIINLPATMKHPESVCKAQGYIPDDYITLMQNDSVRAEKFTKMLYELHKPVADKVVDMLDLTNVKRLMDLGGGSGVISFEILKKKSDIEITVVDIENVNKIGRKIAENNQQTDRISFHSSNFLVDDLPRGFDQILICDVGVYNLELFQNLYESLNKNGNLIIISNLNEQGAWLNDPNNKKHLLWYLNSFLNALEVPNYDLNSVKDIELLLTKAEFKKISSELVDGKIIKIKALKN